MRRSRLAWMTAVGERTSSVLIGTSVMTPTFRYNPAVVAQAFAHDGRAVPGPHLLAASVRVRR